MERPAAILHPRLRFRGYFLQIRSCNALSSPTCPERNPSPTPAAAARSPSATSTACIVGHQSLLTEALRRPRPAVAVTFDPHPIQLLRPDRVEPFLSTLDDRANLLLQYGVDHVLILQTTPSLLQLTPREFFERIVVEGLHARALVEGYSFSFGRGREGTLDVLKHLCAEKNVGLTLLPPCEVLGQPVSSSRVRRELQAGNVEVARQLLGRPYRLAGVVGTGAKRGATLGFPTANLEQIATLIPGNGVYAGARRRLEGTELARRRQRRAESDLRRKRTQNRGASARFPGRSLRAIALGGFR